MAYESGLMMTKFLLVMFLCLSIIAYPDRSDAGSVQKSVSESAYQQMKLERVVDGDTFIASGKCIRLWGINAPEKDKPLYDLSSKFLKALISDGKLSCKFLYVDPFKRDVMHCSIDGVDVGSAMVRWGMATDYKKYSDGFYSEDQDQAKSKRLGIWSKN